MAPRPIWRGHLRISLVSCPVRLFTALTGRERISFHLLNPETKNRIQMRPTDPETGKEVPRGELIRGYEFEKGRYVVIDKEELDALKVDSSETIDLERFVELGEVDPLYLETPYYMAPEGKLGDETFRVIHEAMRRKKMAGLGRLSLSTHEHGIVLRPHDRGLLLTTLRPTDEVRDVKEYAAEIGTGPVDKEMVQLAERILGQKAGKFDPDEFAEDRYQAALRHLVEQKVKGEAPVIPKAAPRPSNVVNLMDALKRSIESGGGKPAPQGKRRGRAAPDREAAIAAHAGGKPARRKRRSS
ncbi:MAG TPA: Ku protein [Stellaceae bacterium]|nr:Ku protein [Stellaceae bacterium]